MNKNIAGIGIASVAILAIGGVVIANMPEKSNNTASTDSRSTMDMNETSPGASKQNDGNSEENLTGQMSISMDIKDFAFAKKSITISKGTKVTWTNQDDAKHNVFSEDAGGPQGKLLAQGETFDYVFDKVGKFNYICEPHPYMKGAVNVVE